MADTGTFNATYGAKTSSTGLSATIMGAYYSKLFLKILEEQVVLAQFAQDRNFPRNEGKTGHFFRYLPIDALTTALTEGENPTPTAITGTRVSATLEEWGGYSQHASLLKMTALDRNLKGTVKLWGANAASTVDLRIAKELAGRGHYPIIADATSYEADTGAFEGTLTTATSTTSVADTSLTSNTGFGDTDDDLNQSIICFTGGANYGQARQPSNYAQATGTVSFDSTDALDNTPTTSDTYRVVNGAALTAGTDILTTDVILHAVTKLEQNKAPTWDNGMFAGVLSPQTKYELMTDTGTINWATPQMYRDNVSGLFRNEVGEWAGVRWVKTTQPFRFPISSTLAQNNNSYGPGIAGANYG
ncbi:MAG: N4-gp56 family major capsid protein, partial [Planctomycetota bacterium]